ncbi:MAG: hypothetical protein AAF572_14410 [Cyanobacteria bacterium P01_B01_bin.77]
MHQDQPPPEDAQSSAPSPLKNRQVNNQELQENEDEDDSDDDEQEEASLRIPEEFF